MSVYTESFMEFVREFLSAYSYFLSGQYYVNMFSKYFSISGFFIGLIMVLLIYFSADELKRKKEFFKVLMIIAVINSCAVLLSHVYYLVLGHNPYEFSEVFLSSPDNIISGFILTLVITSNYKDDGGRAFFFGVATYSTLLLINFQHIGYMNDVNVFIIIVRIFFAGFLCSIISRREHFYTGWIWYFGFHMLVRLAVLTTWELYELNLAQAEFDFKIYLSNLAEYLSRFPIDYIIFAVILIFAIIFEKAVLSDLELCE